MSAEDQLREIACPECGEVGTIKLDRKLIARPLGSHSLSGNQMKVSAVNSPALVCSTPECGFYKLPKDG